MPAEKIYKKVSSFFDQCIKTAVSLLKMIMRSKFSIRMPKAHNESCIILGNGPSLKTSLKNNPSAFTTHPLVCVNSFSTTEEYLLLKPQYYVILDFAFWLNDDKVILDTIEALKTKTTWPLHLFVPRLASKSKRFKTLCDENKNIHLTYFNYSVFNGFPSIAHFFYRKNLAMPQSQNVLVAAIFLSINIGFKKMILVGADHTWHQTLHVNDNNILCFKDAHFYENEEKANYIPFKKGAHLTETFRMHEIMTTLGKTFYGYEVLKKYADNCGVDIYNASEVSFIDAFERKKL